MTEFDAKFGADQDGISGTLGGYLSSSQGGALGASQRASLSSISVDFSEDAPSQIRQQQWTRILAKLRSIFGDDYHQRHLSTLRLGLDVETATGLHIVLRGAQTSGAQIKQLEKRLLSFWRSEDALIAAIQVESASSDAAKKPLLNDHHQRLDSKFSFGHFVAAEPNEFAYAAAMRVAESPDAQYNPLFLFGGVGLGKTHLMTAIALHRQQNFPEQKVLYLTAETFMRRFVEALRSREMMQFKQEFRQVDMLLIDDIHFIANKTSTQDEFLHTLNALIEQGKHVVLASDRAPNEILDMENRVRSRLGAGLVAEILAPDEALRARFLAAQVARAKVDISPEVTEYLAAQLPISIRELEGAMNRLIAHQDLIKRTMTLDMCRKILRDVLHQPRLKLTIDAIQRAVADYYRIRPEDMSSSSRARPVARPRQVAMYLAKKLTSKSLPEIGRNFGGRDHTTVMHGLKKVTALCNESEDWAEDIRRLTDLLQQ